MQALAIFAAKNELILSAIVMSGGKRSYIDKRELRKKLNIKYMRHNRRLKMNFFAGKHLCVSSQYH